MLAIERRNAILAKLATDGKVIVSDLSTEFNVTEETIRRDLEKLDKEGLAKKTYGGAIVLETHGADLPFNVRKRVNANLKENIAQKIAELISDGDSIILDSSTTAISVTKYIKNRENLTLITNSVEILLELSDKSGWKILSTGGKLKNGSLALVGASAEQMIRDYHVHIAVCSSKGIDMNMGISDSNEEDASMKKAIFSSADRKILAIDSTKFNRRSFVKVFSVSDVDTVVTDEKPSDEWIEFFEKNQVELIY
ncbi:MAG: DeoR/GlpR transcriptional regulator [Clostridia bacterium]|nr:DeoR/GlpR transcriptional regulator [Clostridia bacterium]